MKVGKIIVLTMVLFLTFNNTYLYASNLTSNKKIVVDACNLNGARQKM